MDLFKKANMKQATAWDWNCPVACKKGKGDTQRLHKISRAKLKEHDRRMQRTIEEG